MAHLSAGKQDLLTLLLEQEVLRFGEFKTKSGRISPFFFNTGRIDNATALAKLADHYVDHIAEHYGDQVTGLFGPAYKGIPLAVSVGLKLSERLGRNLTISFDRKEAKAHGEGGRFVGHQPTASDRLVLVEDVITAGTALRHTLGLLQQEQVGLLAAVVAIDREERGQGEQSARAEIAQDFGLPVDAILPLREIVAALHNQEVAGQIWVDDHILAAIDAYRSRYGVV